MVSYSTRRKSVKANRHAEILKRLTACREQVDNLQCADCGDAKPAWASLLKPPPNTAGTTSKKVGIFCCYKCCSYHFQLGRDICEVKNIKSADDWTEEEVKTMEASGNAIANAIYEGLITTDENQKPNPANHDAQAKFVKQKYKRLTFFCKKTYQAHGSWFVAYQQNEKASKKNNKGRSSTIYSQMGADPHTPQSLMAQLKVHAQQKQHPNKQSPFPTIKAGTKDNGKEIPIAIIAFPSGDVLGYDDDHQEGNHDSHNLNDSADLSYGEDPPVVVDLGYGQEADDDNESSDDDEASNAEGAINESLQDELARRSIIGGGYIRRGLSGGRRESLGRRGSAGMGSSNQSSRSMRRDSNSSMRRDLNASRRRRSNTSGVSRESNASMRRGSNASARSPGRRTSRIQPDGSPISRRASNRRATMSVVGGDPARRPSVTRSYSHGNPASRVRQDVSFRRQQRRRNSTLNSGVGDVKALPRREPLALRRDPLRNSVQRNSSSRRQSIGSRASTRSSSGNDTSDYSDASFDDDDYP